MTVTLESLMSREDKIAVVGLGYVGLPLAVQLAKHFDVVGFDLKTERIQELKSGHDRTLEVSEQELKAAQIFYTDDAQELSRCRFIIVAVPTPIDQYRIPDLRPLHGASHIVGKHLAKGSCVVFESTVYPGTTEEECVPIMEKESGLKFGTDFSAGYSPERINPGDKVHTVENIVKIVSGSDKAALEVVTGVYGKVVKAGLHKASSIKVAEAAKVIENTQRDLNIALMNELAMIFDKMGIDTTEVLEAAGTKWNFLPFRPGLVGGHCLSKDQLVFAKIAGQFKTLEIEALFNSCTEKTAAPDFQADAESENCFLNAVCGHQTVSFDSVSTRTRLRLLTPSNQTDAVRLPEETEILSYNTELKRAEFKKVTLLTKRNYGNLIQFTTSSNQTVKVSDDHPMIVHESGKFAVKLAKDVTLSDKFVVNTKLPELDVPKTLDIIDLLGEETLKNVRVKPVSKQFKDYQAVLAIKKNRGVKPSNFYIGNYLPLKLYLELECKGVMPIKRDEIFLVTGRGSSYNQIRAVIAIDEDFARLVGYYLSEGCISQDNTLRTRWTFHSEEKEYLDDVCKCISGLGCRYSVYRSKTDKAVCVKLSSDLFGRLLSEVLHCGKNSYDAAAPDFLLYASENIKTHLLKGLLRGDGGVKLTLEQARPYTKNSKDYTSRNCGDEVTYFSSSKKLFHQVVLLLQDFGVTMSFDKERPLLYIHGHENLSKLREMFLGEKRAKIEQYFEHKVRFVRSRKYESFRDVLTVGLKQIERCEDDYVYSVEVDETETIVTDYGLVVHNCIGVDPYYLTFKAESLGYHPEMILAGRRINDGMGKFVAERAVKMLIGLGKQVRRAKIAVLGITFKENVPDLRNTKVVDIIAELKDYEVDVLVHDPLADPAEAKKYYGLELSQMEELAGVDGVIVAVIHDVYKKLGLSEIMRLCTQGASLVIDVKGAFSPEEAKKMNIKYWRL